MSQDPKQPKLKYFLYARKSSESEDRQVQSIEDQNNSLNKIADTLKLEVVDTIAEARSAKKPNNRPLFSEMLRRIEKGEANGILCWQLNRLSRNPVDSGEIQWLLQQGIIKSIRTPDREYLPEDNALIYAVESGTANQFILDLKKGVKRGLQSKLEKGWLPCSAPLGYLNTKTEIRGENYIVKDPERFSVIRKAWDLMLTGNHTPPKILDILNNKWGFKTRQTKRQGGKEMGRSTIYAIFTNQFYAGLIPYMGKVYEGKHEPMVTLDEFDRVQILLGREGKPRPKQHIFAFTGCIHCGECNCLLTAIEKTKLIKKDNKLKTFTYYYCTRRKNDIDCSQRKSLALDKLELQIEREIEKYTILPEFRDWAIEILNENNDTEIEDRSKIYGMQHNALVKTQAELDELARMRYRGLITDDEFFIKERDALEKKIVEIKAQLRETEGRADKWLELTEKTFNFALYAHKTFLTGTLEAKKEILRGLGENPILKDRELNISAYEWLVPIGNDYPALETEYLRLEPEKLPMNAVRTEALASIRTRWRGRPDSNR